MDTKIRGFDTVKPACKDVGGLPASVSVSALQNSVCPSSLISAESTLDRHLARRLVQIGTSDVFSFPDDFNLTLLDHLIAEPGLNLISCCNELNAGYATDGYAQSHGLGACVIAFTVSGLSVFNAIADAYSKSLSVIYIVRGPNSNDYGTNRILHHTIGYRISAKSCSATKRVTCYQVAVTNLEDAHEVRGWVLVLSFCLGESKGRTL